MLVRLPSVVDGGLGETCPLSDRNTSLEEGERGETDLVEVKIHTGDEPPRKLTSRRMLFVVRQEVARQLCSMQD